MLPRTLTLLGSTGSIGRQTLEVLSNLQMTPFALAAGSNDRLMEEQIRAFHPRFAAMADREAGKRLKAAVADTDTLVTYGEDAVEMLAALPSELTLAAMSGVAGLKPTLTALETGHNIALANKETLVCGGRLVTSLAKKMQKALLPVDSEHSAIFQSLRTGSHDELTKIILTCSGGPFFGKKPEELEKITPQEALKHPNWRMGPKITVDCATLMNKGLELMEAMHLFDLPADRVEIVIHRESVFHSFVEFADGAVVGQAASPDMRLPIQYAITYPERRPLPITPLHLSEIGRLTFYSPDLIAFPCLRLAMETAQSGSDALPIILNGANESAVAAFLAGKISFGSIPRAVAYALEHTEPLPIGSYADIHAQDQSARRVAENYLGL